MHQPFVAAAISRQDGLAGDGIHLLWTAPPSAGYSVKGYDIQRRASLTQRERICYTLTSDELLRLHRDLRLETSLASLAVRRAECPTFPSQPPDEPFHEPTPKHCVDFRTFPPKVGRNPRTERGVTFRLQNPPGVLAIALRDGKAVDTRMVTSGSGLQEATFQNRAVDRVLLYTSRPASSLTVCVDVLPDPKKEEAEWSGVTYIAKNIQMPLRAVNGALTTPAAEDSLASSRLLAGESFDAAAFRQVADAMNEAAAEAAVASPVWFTTLTRERTEDQFIEVRAWPYGFALLAEAPWRRMLGFGYLDKGGGLTPGATYDYRITGYFRRRDVEERLYGFHTIPLGTTLPASFHLGDLLLNTLRPARVEMFPAVAGAALRSAGRKGIALEPAGFFGAQSLLITFPSPVMRVVLEFEPAAVHSLSYEAKTSDYLFGLSGATFSDGSQSHARSG